MIGISSRTPLSPTTSAPQHITLHYPSITNTNTQTFPYFMVLMGRYSWRNMNAERIRNFWAIWTLYLWFSHSRVCGLWPHISGSSLLLSFFLLKKSYCRILYLCTCLFSCIFEKSKKTKMKGNEAKLYATIMGSLESNTNAKLKYMASNTQMIPIITYCFVLKTNMSTLNLR